MTIICESNTVYDGQGQYIEDEARAFICDGVQNVLIMNYKFRRVKYGVRILNSSGIHIAECSHEGQYLGDNNENITVIGAGNTTRVKVTESVANGHPCLVLSGDTADSWTVEKSACDGAVDSAIYLRGGGHTIRENLITNAGKDCIKILQRSDGQSNLNGLVERNTVINYGLVKNNAGGAINIEAEGTTVRNNVAILTQDSLTPSGTRCYLIRAPWCHVFDNIAASDDAFAGREGFRWQRGAESGHVRRSGNQMIQLTAPLM